MMLMLCDPRWTVDSSSTKKKPKARVVLYPSLIALTLCRLLHFSFSICHFCISPTPPFLILNFSSLSPVSVCCLSPSVSLSPSPVSICLSPLEKKETNSVHKLSGSVCVDRIFSFRSSPGSLKFGPDHSPSFFTTSVFSPKRSGLGLDRCTPLNGLFLFSRLFPSPTHLCSCNSLSATSLFL